VAKIGVEVVTPEGRDLVRKQRADEARQAGLEPLPPAVLGSPFPFTLTNTKGQRLRSEELRGKPGLLGCWSRFHALNGPLMRTIQERATREGGDLHVIGICLDKDMETMRQSCQRLGLTWLQVLVPTDEVQRQLWEEASEVNTVPRLLVIDRAGV